MLNYDKPIILVDTSYYVFYRWFALCSWYKLSQKKEPDIEHILEDELFMEKYDKLFITTLDKFKKKHKIKEANIIFARDCKRKDIWRHEFNASYKGTRDEKMKNFNGGIFVHTYNKIFPILIKNEDTYVFQVPNVEADDIIGVLKNKIREDHPNIKIFIIANDHDYLQLFDNNTEIFNLKGLDLRTKSKGDIKTDLLLKIIKGDVSDNITSIFGKKVSEKFALNYVLDDAKLQDFLNSNEEAKKKFDNNQKLIDFKFIPIYYQTEISNLIK